MLRAPYKKTILLLTALFGVFVLPHLAHAAGAEAISAILSPVTTTINILAYYVMILAAKFMQITAFLLDGSIKLNLNILQFVESNGAIEIVWKVIRDFSSIFIIFMLLYAAITMILGVEGPSFKKLIINIVIAGLMINFSLFITKVAIDASNVIALSFYSAIDSAGNKTLGSSTTLGSATLGTYLDIGQSRYGLSNAFMQGLRVQSVMDKVATFSNWFSGLNASILIISLGGAAVMIAAGLSFLAAAVMFVSRLGLLLLLLAFSPLPWVAMILPAVAPKAKEWTSKLVGQCVFAPLYLMLMYVVLKIVTDQHFSQVLGIVGNSSLAEDFVNGKGISAIMLYVIVIFLINAGLAASVEYAGESGSMAMSVHKWTKGKINSYARATGAGAYRSTIGAGASMLAKNESLKDFASRSAIGAALLKGTRGVASDYDKRTKEQIENRVKFAESLGPNKKELAKLESARNLAESVHTANKEALVLAQAELAAAKRDEANASDPTAKASAQAMVVLKQRNVDAIKNRIDDKATGSDAKLKAAKDAVRDEKNRRVTNYQKRYQNKDNKTRTIWKIISAERAGAADQIYVDQEEEKLKKAKDDLTEIKSDIKRLEDRSRGKDGITADETTKLQSLYSDRSKKEKDIQDSQRTIDSYKK